MKKALVLGGGGHYGIAWELGYLKGLEEGGLKIRDADIIAGTSAGSQVAAMISSNKKWETIWKEQIETLSEEVTPISNEDMGKLFEEFNILEKSDSAKEWIDGVGNIAKRTSPVVAEEERLEMIKLRLGSGIPEWNKKLRIVATDVDSSERIVFDSNSDVDILKAISASSALPGVWPLVKINDHQYFDGGSYSMENPDVIKDADIMIVLSTGLPIVVPYELDNLVKQLNENGTVTEAITPDMLTMNVLKDFSYNTMEAKIRPYVAQTGFEQGLHDSKELSKIWKI